MRSKFTFFVSEMNSIVLMTFLIRFRITFEQAQFVQLYIRRSRTIIAAAKRRTKKIYNEDLKYAELEYACINGGKNFKTTSTGERPNQRLVSERPNKY